METKFVDGTEITPYLACAYAEGFCEGDGASAEDQVKAWSHLIGMGDCWKLQGWYGRRAASLIENGFISPEGEVDWGIVGGEDQTLHAYYFGGKAIEECANAERQAGENELVVNEPVKDRLESIKPKQPSGNERYPETRVEVKLKGATLEQTVQLLYRIETAPAHLIVRSLRIKSRPDGTNLLDVSLSVSSFEQA